MPATVSEIEIDIPLQPKQADFYDLVENSPATWIGYGGSRGGSKSNALRAIILLRRLKYPKTRGVIFRRTYEKVRENHIEPMLAAYPFMIPWFNKQNKEINLPNGSAILFRYAENPGDVDSYIGKEYMDFGVDQAEMLTEKELNTLKSCTRWPGVRDNQCKFLLTFNPGNVGHNFLKRIFFSKDYRGKERPQDYAFLQAFGWDNVEWSKSALNSDGMDENDYYSWTDSTRFQYFVERAQYGRELDALPESLRVGWLLGDMNRFAGQYFDCFETAVHCKHPAEIKLEPWWPRWISIDWGFEHPAAVYWHAKDGDYVITYREMCERHMEEPRLALEIANRSNADKDSHGKPIPIQAVFISPDANAKRGSAHTTMSQIGAVLKENGLPGPTPADNDRIGGARLCYNMLKSGLATISTDCHKLIECLPSLTHEDGNEEDVLKVDGDDAYDAWRYGLKSYLRPGKKPEEIAHQEKLASITDPLSKHFYNLTYHAKREAAQSGQRNMIVPRWAK